MRPSWLRCGCCDPRKLVHLKLESGPMAGPDDEVIEVQRRVGAESHKAIMYPREAGHKALFD